MAVATVHSLDDAPRPRGAARREALLEAALRVIADSGADALTHRRVAEVAGLPLASTTYWFRSKEHMLTAAFELAAERDIARLDEIVAGAAPGTDPCETAVSAILEPIEELTPATRRALTTTYALLLEAARHPELQAASREWTETYLRALSELLERAGSTRPRADAQLLLAAADGVLIEQLTSGREGDPRPELTRLAHSLVAAP